MKTSIYTLFLLTIALVLFQIYQLSCQTPNDIIIDSRLTFQQAMKGTNAPKEIIDSLSLLDVRYYSFDGKLHKGQIVVHTSVVEDVKAIFELIESTKFPINKVIPIVHYDWSDDASMEDDNTSSFCYRTIAGTNRLSKHALGKAVDINPRQNPVIYSSGKISPSGAKYDTSKPGTFSANNAIVKEFIKRGWRWGGNFNDFKDNHHFDK